MILRCEKLDGQYKLVGYAHALAEDCTILATFEAGHTAALWIKAQAEPQKAFRGIMPA